MEIKLNSIDYQNLKQLKIKIKDGLINGIVGSNGSGKSAMADIMSTMAKPNKGSLQIDGISIDSDNPMIDYDMIRFDVGYVMQDASSQMFCGTVEEQIKFLLNQYNYKNDKKRIKDSLKMVSIDESFLKRKIDSLSDGETFKISLASVLAINPKILILDEPTAFLDYGSTKELIKIIRMLKNRYHKTIVVLSKDTDFIHEICDYIYILGSHKIVVEGNKYDVFTQTKQLLKYNINPPKIIEFEQIVHNKKKIKMGYRDNINDLLKDVYFYKN